MQSCRPRCLKVRPGRRMLQRPGRYPGIANIAGRKPMKSIAFVSIMGTALLASTAVLGQVPSWTPPPESERCPSKWGAGDERGSGNHMKPQTLLNAIKLIKTGEVI